MKKPRPESEPTTPTTFAPPEPKPRKSSKGQFVIQQAVPADGNTPAGWADIPSLPDLRSTADCRDYIKRNGLAGSYRVIIVRDTFSTIARTKVVISFE